MRQRDEIVDALRASGELWQPAAGLAGLRGAALARLHHIEGIIAGACAGERPEEWRVPQAVPLTVLQRAQYFASFPQWLTLASHLDGDQHTLERVATSLTPAHEAANAALPADAALPPAVCYHVYAALADSVVDAPRIVTAQGCCWRHEGERFEPLARGWAFTMRELVCIGTEDQCAAFVERGVALARAVSDALDIPAEVATATDPFFAPTARGQALLQRLKALKHELLVPVGDGDTIAAASFNLHEAFFGNAFDIRLPDGNPAHTACVAFGLERWLLASLVARPLVTESRPPRHGLRGSDSRGNGRAPSQPRSISAAGCATGPALYARHARAADRGTWSVERDIAWGEIDPSLVTDESDMLLSLREAALIEAYHPVHLQRMLAETWDDVDAGVICSLELYEGFKHFHAIRTYLDAVKFEPAITDDDIVAMRRTARASDAEPPTLIARLVEFMLSEHLASYFFRRLAEQTREPVLARLLGLIAADEVRHAQSASDLIAKRIDADPSLVDEVLEAAAHFHHFGERAVGEVPVAMPGDPIAIATFARRIERLCGVRLVDHIKESL